MLAPKAQFEGRSYLWTAPPSLEGYTSELLSYYAVVALAEGLQLPGGEHLRIVVATFGSESVLDENVCDYIEALAKGPMLALPAEVPGLKMRIVDFDAKGGTNDDMANA